MTTGKIGHQLSVFVRL